MNPQRNVLALCIRSTMLFLYLLASRILNSNLIKDIVSDLPAFCITIIMFRELIVNNCEYYFVVCNKGLIPLKSEKLYIFCVLHVHFYHINF